MNINSNLSRTITFGFVAAAGLATVLALPAAAVAEDTSTAGIETLAAESATTPAQHEALAAYYRQKAADARAEASRHRQMELAFSSRSAGADAGMRMHCDRLVSAAQKDQVRFESIAAEHEAEAKKAAN